MTPSEKVKATGLDSLTELVNLSDISRQTLINWHWKKPDVFDLVLSGAVIKKFTQAGKPYCPCCGQKINQEDQP